MGGRGFGTSRSGEPEGCNLRRLDQVAIKLAKVLVRNSATRMYECDVMTIYDIVLKVSDIANVRLHGYRICHQI